MESIGQRVSRIVAGGINALVDKAENISPIAVMNQAVREIDAAIADIRQELGKATVEEKRIKQSVDKEKNRHTELLEQINTAIAEERDDLAEAGIAKQMDIEAQLPVLEESLKEIQGRIKKYEEYIGALKGKKSQMQDDIELFKKTNKDLTEENAVNGSIDKALEAFNRVGGMDITGDAKPEEESKLEQLAELQKNSRIQTRLAALKAKQANA